MKPMSGIIWLLLCMVIYMIAGITDLYLKFCDPAYLEMAYVFCIGAPLVLPMSKIVNIDPFWKW